MQSDSEQEREQNAKTIAAQNDRFRGTWGADFTIPGRIVLTTAVAQLGVAVHVKIMQAVQNFDGLTEENDPTGEHEIGVFQIEGKTFRWKIDLYDGDFRHSSEHRVDAANTRRVLTIMTPQNF